MNLQSYNLVAYEVETNTEVLSWNGVGPTRRFHAGDVIIEGRTCWHVVGVREGSTQLLWLINVRKEDAILRQYIEEDLFNELRWLLCAATEWDAHDRLSGEPPQAPKMKEPCFHLKVYAMGSALLHARALYEFFTATKFHKDRLTWRDYSKRAYQKSEIYEQFREPLHGRVMHLNKNRSGYDEVKREVVTLAKDILDLWDRFTIKPGIEEYSRVLRDLRAAAIRKAENVASQYKELGYGCPFS